MSKSTIDMKQESFIPFGDIIKLIKEQDPVRYDVKFSLTPFLNSYSDHVTNGCSMAASYMMPKVDEVKSTMNCPEFLDETSSAEMDEQLRSMFAMFLPSLAFNDAIVAVHTPFIPDFKYSTPGMKTFIDNDDWEIDLSSVYKGSGDSFNSVKCGSLILNKLYGQNIDLLSNAVFAIRNKKTKLEKYFKMVANQEYINIHVNGELPDVTQKDIQYLLRNLDNADLWLEKLPADIFSFEGFMIGTLVDVTESVVIQDLKLSDVDQEFKAQDYQDQVQQSIRNFLNDKDIYTGFIASLFSEFIQDIEFSISGLSNGQGIKEIKSDPSSIYGRVIESRSAVLVEDLSDIKNKGALENALLSNGINSVILYPLFSADGKLSSIMEIGSSKANVLNALSMIKMQPIFDIIQVNDGLFMREMDNRTNLFIQNQFTSIHPSVEWKFEEVARKFQVGSALEDFSGLIEPIVFKDVFPLYGQADIVGSSAKRNAGIQADLVDNLFKIRALIFSWLDKREIHILRSYYNRVDKLYKRIEKNFVTSDESIVVDLLTNEIHPFIHQLKSRFTDLPQASYSAYFNYLDANLGIVYRERKKYERSVGKLNQAISDYIEADDAELQEILPHYFEKYKTDGIEYNMYVGQSIVPDIEFGSYYLKEFKLRQLVQLCEVTKLVDRLAPTLDVPLSTAQLVFAYNHSLSIRFRMDEKQFDVDGAYNVRYEILKKRIDKAIIKGTEKRLTVAGKIAIVYLQDTDRREYMEYIDYLIDQDLIEKDIEILDLEKLQGAEGLKALRLTVKKATALDNQLKELESEEVVV